MNITDASSKAAIITSSLEYIDTQDLKIERIKQQRNILGVLFCVAALLYAF